MRVEVDEIALRREKVDNPCRIGDSFLHRDGKIDPQMLGGFKVEEAREADVNCVAHDGDRLGGRVADILHFLGEMPCHETQPPDAKAQIMVAEEIDAFGRCALAARFRNMIEAARPHLGPNRSAQVVKMLGTALGPSSPRSCNNVIDRARQLQMAVSLI